MYWIPTNGDVLVANGTHTMEGDTELFLTDKKEYHVSVTMAGELYIVDDMADVNYIENNWHKFFFPPNSVRTNDAGETLQSTEATLKERGNRYGEYSKVAYVSQEIKNLVYAGVVSAGKNPDELPVYIRESLDMIANKLARIINGDPLYDDNWRDIAGYSQLVVDELNKIK